MEKKLDELVQRFQDKLGPPPAPGDEIGLVRRQMALMLVSFESHTELIRILAARSQEIERSLQASDKKQEDMIAAVQELINHTAIMTEQLAKWERRQVALVPPTPADDDERACPARGKTPAAKH